MGEANIAPFRRSDLFYLDLLMAPLHGVAMKVAIEDGQVIDKGALWST